MRDVVGYEGLYKVTSCGKVWNCRTQKFMKPYKAEYLMINLIKNGHQHNEYVHRLVAKAYIPNPDNLPCVNHKDENKHNPAVPNLEWCTRKYNNNYGTRCARIAASNGKAVYCIELDTTYPSLVEAGRTLHLNFGNISNVCHGKLKTTGGYHFRFAN